MSMALMWFIVAAVFLLLELVVPGLVLLFFGLGALLVSLVLLFVPLDLAAQVWLFSISSIASLLLLRRLFLSVFSGRSRGAAEDLDAETDVVGERAEVVQAIAPNQPGRIKFRGSFWVARAKEPIDEGSAVEVMAVQGLECDVRKIS